MIRRGFRAILARAVPAYYIDALFSMASSIVLSLVVIFWQSSSVVLYELEGFARWMARLVFLLVILGSIWGVRSLRAFDPFGRRPIKDYLEGNRPQPARFEVGGPYQWVRHPLYFFVLVMLWSSPDLTVDRLLLNATWTIWIYMGTILEEEDLIAEFDEDYRSYQKLVPMLIPWKISFCKHKY